MTEDNKTTVPPQPSAASSPPPPETKPTTEVIAAEEPPAAVPEKAAEKEEFASFKEESNVVGELNDAHKKALDEFKQLVQDALKNHQFYAPIVPVEPKKQAEDANKEGKPETETETEKKEDAKVEEPSKDSEKVVEEVKKDIHATVAEAKKEDTKVEEPSKESEKVVQEVKKDLHATAVETKKEDTKAEKPSKESEKVVEEVKKDMHATSAEAKKEDAKVETPSKELEKVVQEVKKDLHATADEPKKEEIKVEEERKKTEEPKTSQEPSNTPGDDAAKVVEPIQDSVVEVPVEEEAPEPELAPEEVSIYGIPLLADEKSDTILLKFLRARDFKVKDAFTMLKNTVRWRKEFGVDDLVEEDLGNDWDKVMFVHGSDKEGHPVCYNVYGEFMDKELYSKTFGDEEKRNKFIKWVIQSLEKSVRKLDFGPTGISSIVQVNDLSNSPGLLKRELRQTTDKALQLLQDNYPEFVAKQVFVNVPWWYLAFYTVISPFLTQRSKSKFVISSAAKAADTLFNYIAPEQVPLQYGGLNCQGKQEFSAADAVSEVTIKASSKQSVEFPVSEKSHFVWQLRVIGWDVFYGAEFVPDAEDGYTVIVQKSRKITAPDEPVIFNGYKVSEPGKIVVTINNTSSKKKKLLYRSKSIPISG